MNQDKLKGIIEEALLAMSDPPGKSKRPGGLAGLTGPEENQVKLEENQVKDVISELKRGWKVTKITPPVG